MKKVLKTGKKALSVFMAVLMVMTAWVFVASEKASAATAGSYYFRITYSVDNKEDHDKGAFTGSNGESKDGMIITYTKQDGSTGTYLISLCGGTSVDGSKTCNRDVFGEGTNLTCTGRLPGAPTQIRLYIYGSKTDIVKWYITKFELASNSGMSENRFDLWTGKVGCSTDHVGGQSKNYTIDFTTNQVTEADDANPKYTTMNTINYKGAPSATSVRFISGTTAIATPKTGAADVSKEYEAGVYDQYGVRMTHDPTLVLRSTAPTSKQTSNSSIAGVSLGSSSNSKATLTVNSNAQLGTIGENSKTFYIHAYYGSLFTSGTTDDATNNKYANKTVTITDPKYSIKYYLNGGSSLSTDTNLPTGFSSSLISNSYYYYDVYYGETIKSQGTIDSKNSYPKYGTRAGHTFKGMFTLPNSTTPMDINEQITSDKIYYAQWDKNTYTVVYLDRMNQNVVYVDNVIYQGASNSNAAKEQLNATEYDTINHYLLNTSNPWTIVSGSSNLTSITGNTFVRANYNSGEHTFGDPVDVAATCQHKAGKKYTCSVCGYSYVQETGTTGGDHVESTDYIVDTPATCQATGSAHYYCTVCGATTRTITLSKIPHAYNSTTNNATCIATGSINYTCAVCGATASTTLPKTAHNFVPGTAVAATCTSSGYTPYTCSTSGCTASYNSYDSTKPATAHTWEVYAQSEGSVTLKCTPCGATKTITVDADLTGHDFSGVTAAIETAPTCAAAGTATLACKKTGCTKTISITIPKLTNSHTSVTTTYTAVNGHTNGSIVTKCTTCNTTLSTTTIEAPADCVFINNGTATEPTCTQTGSQPTKCIYCNTPGSTTIPATGHKTVTVAATCGTRGYVKCAVCDLELSSTDPTGAHIAATTPLVDIPATCTEDGLYIVCCKNCNAVMENTPRPATDHTWGNWETVIEPICGVKGIERRSCSVCHAIENRDLPAYAADHSDGDQVVVADVPASCTAAGKYVVKCSICNDTIINEVRQPSGHNYSGQVTAPTCYEAGYTRYTCINSGCTETYVSNYVAPVAHNMEVDVDNSAPATCESRGYNKMVCRNYGCTYYYYDILPMLDHDFVPSSPVVANCTEGGYTRYECSRCGKIEKRDIVDPTGHQYNTGTVIREATEASPIGVIEYECTVCHSKIYEEYVLDATDHVWSPKETFDATCTTDGTITYKCVKPNCQACADANASPVTFTKVIPALGHDMDDGVYLSEAAKPTCTESGTLTFSCQRAGCTYSKDVEVDATGHNYPTSYVEAPTCTEKGYTEYICDVCNYTMKDSFVNSLGHSEVTTVIAPTCVKPGYTKVTCSRCNYTYIGEESIKKPTGHTETITSYDAPTCTETGSRTYGCLNCTKYERTEEVPATGHTYGAEPVDATCTTPGYIIHTCIHGDDTYNELICPPTAHPFGEWVVEKAQTNTENGMKVRTCPDCGLSEHEVIPMDGHVWDDGVVKKAPKCTETGEMEFKCTVADCPACDALGYVASYIQIIPATGHNVVVERTEPTCSQTGKITYNCQNAECDYKAFEDVEIATIAHTWSEGFYKKEEDKPTCQKSGILTYTCTECNDGVTTEVVSMLPHDYIVVHTDATCVTAGYNTYTCSGCGLCYTIALPGSEPRLGHTFTELVRHEEPTCKAEGFTINKCVRCEETNTEVIEPTGHDWSDWEVTIEAGCSTPGLETRYCRNNPTEHIQKNTLTATGLHRWVKTVVEPTCTQMGFTIFSCKTCELVKRGEFIPSLGHNLDAGVYQPATCTKDGGTLYTCQREGCTFKYFKKDADALGHSMSKYEYVVHPDDANAYAKERRCTRTDCTFKEYEKTAGVVNKYYKVEFINEWATNSYIDPAPDKTADFDGTFLAETYKTVVLETVYVREGREATYTGTTPLREKDLDYGIYEFTGWKLDDTSASLSNVTQNINATAEFVGGDMYYYVVFQNPINGKHYSPEYKVLHGHPITYTQAEPGMFSNNHYRYIFDHWDRDLSHIYSSGGINAMFNMVPDETTIVYHDWNGTRLGSEVVQYHQAAQNAPTNLSRPANSTYIYEFSGKWTLPGGEEFDLTCPEFANGTESIDVYARYYQKFVDYRVTIQVVDADAHFVPNAPVQILDSRGQLAYTGYTNEEGSLTITVRYDTLYTAQVTDSLGGAVQATFTVPHNPPVELQYEDNRDYESSNCKCICHSFLGGMWITMLNILYKLFKLKHVCCYDMFATHGDRLAYTK